MQTLRCVPKVTLLGVLVMVSRIDTGVLLGTLNSMMPNLMDAEYDGRNSGLVTPSKMKYLIGRICGRVL